MHHVARERRDGSWVRPGSTRGPTAAAARAAASAAARATAPGSDNESSEGESGSDGESEGSDDSDEGSDCEGGGGRQAAQAAFEPDPYELTCKYYHGDNLTSTCPRGFGVTVERYERARRDSVRTVTYAGEHMLVQEGDTLVRKREGHGTERCEGSGGAQRVQGQWRADCFYGLGERQRTGGSVERGQWVLGSLNNQAVLQGWGARYRSGDAPAPYQHGKFVLDDAGCSVLESGENSDLPQAHEQALEAALEEAAQRPKPQQGGSARYALCLIWLAPKA